jgi:hypothetical protein
MSVDLNALIQDGVDKVVTEGASLRKAARDVIKQHGAQSVTTENALRKRIGRAVAKQRTEGLLPDSVSELEVECAERGINPEKVSNFWWKGKHLSIHVKGEKAPTYNEIKDSIVAEMKAHAPVYPVIKRPQYQHPYLLVVDPADAHFGKYSSATETGEESNLSLTEKRFADGIEGLINKVSGYDFEKIIFVGGNDILHTDNAFRTTTSGTPQDTDRMWHEHYLSAKRATIAAIDRLLTIADVHFVFCPSNHDFVSGFFLADAIRSHYHNNHNITFDCDPIHRKYVQYGTSLIGLTHADGAKESELPDLMKTEAKAAWSLSKYAYWYCHHIHHKKKTAKKGTESVAQEKDYRGVTVLNTGLSLVAEDYCNVEYVRSISGTDRWHFTKGFVHAPKAMEAFIHCPIYGQITRTTHLF